MDENPANTEVVIVPQYVFQLLNKRTNERIRRHAKSGADKHKFTATNGEAINVDGAITAIKEVVINGVKWSIEGVTVVDRAG